MNVIQISGDKPGASAISKRLGVMWKDEATTAEKDRIDEEIAKDMQKW